MPAEVLDARSSQHLLEGPPEVHRLGGVFFGWKDPVGINPPQPGVVPQEPEGGPVEWDRAAVVAF